MDWSYGRHLRPRYKSEFQLYPEIKAKYVHALTYTLTYAHETHTHTLQACKHVLPYRVSPLNQGCAHRLLLLKHTHWFRHTPLESRFEALSAHPFPYPRLRSTCWVVPDPRLFSRVNSLWKGQCAHTHVHLHTHRLLSSLSDVNLNSIWPSFPTVRKLWLESLKPSDRPTGLVQNCLGSTVSSVRQGAECAMRCWGEESEQDRHSPPEAALFLWALPRQTSWWWGPSPWALTVV